ncbi:hypothetical protein D3C81_864690 [compost metagenome]
MGPFIEGRVAEVLAVGAGDTVHFQCAPLPYLQVQRGQNWASICILCLEHDGQTALLRAGIKNRHRIGEQLR